MATLATPGSHHGWHQPCLLPASSCSKAVLGWEVHHPGTQMPHRIDLLSSRFSPSAPPSRNPGPEPSVFSRRSRWSRFCPGPSTVVSRAVCSEK